MDALERVFENHIHPYKPDYLVVSLGFDTFYLDPVGHFNLTRDCYTRIGRLLKESGYKILFILEGGYAIEDLGANLIALLTPLSNHS